MTCKSCHRAFDAWDEELGQEWHVPHWNEGHVTHNFLSLCQAGSLCPPFSAMWDVSMAVWLLFHAQHLSAAGCWDEPVPISSLPAVSVLFQMLWDMRLAGVWDTSWALLLWLCWAEPLAFPGIPLRSCPGSAVGWLLSGWGCAFLTSPAFLTWAAVQFLTMLRWGLWKTNGNLHQTLARR